MRKDAGGMKRRFCLARLLLRSQICVAWVRRDMIGRKTNSRVVGASGQWRETPWKGEKFPHQPLIIEIGRRESAGLRMRGRIKPGVSVLVSVIKTPTQ